MGQSNIGINMIKSVIKKAKSKRHGVNPFVGDMTIPIGKQKIKISRLGSDDNILMNQSTGEVQGTHLTTYKNVDSQQFVKLFTANIGLTFELKSAGIKTFSVLVWTLQNAPISNDLVPLDKFILQDFLASQESKLALSLPTFSRGLVELEKAKIIAKNIRQGWYFINPNFIFNGDRIAFTTIIERKKS